MKLLIALEEGEKNVSELVNAVQTAQANVSRQLQKMAEAGIVSRRKEGVTVFCKIADEGIFQLCEHVCGSLQKRLAQQAEAAKLFGG